MEETIAFVITFAITIISILNPVGAVPLFLSITSDHSLDDIKKISTSASITIGITILVSLFLGARILDFFSISVASFRIGGGLLIGSMALKMIRAERLSAKMNPNEKATATEIKELGIVPLAIPMIAGPGTISTCIIFSTKIQSGIQIGALIATVFIITFLMKMILRYSTNIASKVGRLGINVMTRIMGLILLATSVEFITTGLKTLLPGLA